VSTPFRERNPVIVGAVSLAVIAAFILAAFKADSLPLIGGGDTYYAAFSEAGGLKANDEVRIAGVRVGKIESVDLAGDHVRVAFKVSKSAKFGPETGAAIKVKTLLGAMFLALEPSGRGQMKQKAEIPVSRTTSPYDVVRAFSGLASRSKAINTQRLARSLDTLGDLTKTTPRSFRAALSGLSDLSHNVAKRDTQLNSLLRHTEKVSKVLGDRSGDLTKLMRNGDVLFRALVARRAAIHRILVATSQLSIQLTGLVHDTRGDLHPALEHLGRVVDVLNKNQDNLDNSLRLMAPFYKVFANTLSNGPWFDTYIQNLPPVGAPDLGQGG
jgi:phospholipid/cholesterol/gamma-HCH transport system substrate-binding protein